MFRFVALRIANIVSNSAGVAELDALFPLPHEAFWTNETVSCIKAVFLVVALRLAGVISDFTG
jgi:hypothetical protein